MTSMHQTSSMKLNNRVPRVAPALGDSGASIPRHRRRPLLLPSSRRRRVTPPGETRVADGGGGGTPSPDSPSSAGGGSRRQAAVSCGARGLARRGKPRRAVAGRGARGGGPRQAVAAARGADSGAAARAWIHRGSDPVGAVSASPARPASLGGGLLRAEIWQAGSSRSRQGRRRPVHERWMSSIRSG